MKLLLLYTKVSQKTNDFDVERIDVTNSINGSAPLPTRNDRGDRTCRRTRLGWVPFDAQMNVLDCQDPPTGKTGSIRALLAYHGLEPGLNPMADQGILSGCAGILGQYGPGLGREVDT